MPIEIEKLRIANEIASFGLAAFKENAVKGISEIELAAEGMVTSVEPVVYIFGVGAMRIEDNVAVGKNGADILSTFSRAL